MAVDKAITSSAFAESVVVSLVDLMGRAFFKLGHGNLQTVADTVSFAVIVGRSADRRVTAATYTSDRRLSDFLTSDFLVGI